MICDCLVLGKNDRNIFQMVVKNGDESHGIESIKTQQLNKSKII